MIAVIPARRGSKAIPGKNRRTIAGRPLVAWVIEAALGATCVDETVVATDDPEVAEIATRMGALVFSRSAESATDTAPTEAVLQEVLDRWGEEDEWVLLQATSPLTTSGDVERAVELFRSGGLDSLLSVVPQLRFVWEEAPESARPLNYDPGQRPRRQDCDPLLVENGALYVFRAAVLREGATRLGGRIGLSRMAPESYHELDEPADWGMIEAFLRERTGNADRLRDVRLVISDVDGVLTDNGMYWASDGTELKKFSARDGKGFELLHRAGVETALITSEALDLVAARGAKLGCRHVGLDIKDKVAEADVLRRRLKLEWGQIAFVGDDVHDLALMDRVAVSFTPADAVPAVRAAADHVLETRGGRGCFRELADLLLAVSGGARD